MILYYYVLLTIFAIGAALMILDSNVAAYVDLKLRLLYINIRRIWILTTMYPRLTFDKWKFKRALKKQLHYKIKQKNETTHT